MERNFNSIPAPSSSIIFLFWILIHCLSGFGGVWAQTPEQLLEKAHSLVERGDLKGAIPHLTKAISLKPNFGEAYFERGQTYLDLQGFPGAIDDFSKAIQHLPQGHPKIPTAYFNRGYAKMSTRQYPSAIEDYTKAIELNPDMSGAYLHRGECYLTIGKAKEAVADYTKAIDLDNENADAFYQRGLARVKAGASTDACADFKHAESIGHSGATEAFKQFCR